MKIIFNNNHYHAEKTIYHDKFSSYKISDPLLSNAYFHNILVMAESNMYDTLNRTLMYMSRKSLNQENVDLSRGIVLHELCLMLGLEHEYLRSDAAKYILLTRLINCFFH
jgi:hypothetical protein